MSDRSAERELAVEREQQHHFQTYGRQPLVLDRGENEFVWDVDGRRYVDALGGIAVNVLGHCHPEVTKALQDQAARLIHVSNLYYTEVQSKLVTRLSALAGFDRVFLANSGAEAVEGSLKLVRRHAAGKGRGSRILGLEGCFHGRTLATLALGAEKYQEGFGPMPEGFLRLPKGDTGALEAALGDDVAALIVEPIQGEGGIHEVGADYLQHARRLCDASGALLVFDEIQCGNGRTGSMYAWQEYGVKPDVLITAKGLGGGVPIGAILADHDVASALGAGDHGTTFGGNPLSSAAALATLEVLDSEKLPARAARLGRMARERLEAYAGSSGVVREIRGRGLMIGVDLDPEIDGPGVMNRMREHGVLANCTAGTVIRLLPPLTIGEDSLALVLDVLEKAVHEVRNGVEVDG